MDFNDAFKAARGEGILSGASSLALKMSRVYENEPMPDSVTRVLACSVLFGAELLTAARSWPNVAPEYISHRIRKTTLVMLASALATAMQTANIKEWGRECLILQSILADILEAITSLDGEDPEAASPTEH